MRVGIVGLQATEPTAAVIGRLQAAIDLPVVVEARTAETIGTSGVPIEELSATDLIVSVGGDGTLLEAARAAGTTPLIGVNLGEVGFLNAVAPADAVRVVTETVAAIEDGSAAIRERPRLRAQGEDWELPAAINEVVVQGPARGPGAGATIELSVDSGQYTGGQSSEGNTDRKPAEENTDGQYMEGHADGVLVATPTGSTAYNMSEGGPIVAPGVDGLVVTEMAAAEPTVPLVIPDDATVSIELRDADHGYAVADGRVDRELSTPATVTISVAEQPVRLAGPTPDFFEALEKIDTRFDDSD